MKSTLSILLVIIAFSSCNYDGSKKQTADTSNQTNSEVQIENGIYYLEVKGTPYECGVQHGKALANEIKQAVDDYKANVNKTFGEEYGPKMIDWALNKSNFKEDIQKYVPDAWEELKGIAEGSGLPEDDILLIQMFEEVYEAAPGKVGLKLEEVFGNGCTAFAVKDGNKHFVGQNMDYSGNLRHKQLVLKYNTPNGQILCYSFVGALGTNGVNSKGVSVYITTLPQGTKREVDGLGSTFIIYTLLRQSNVSSALEELQRIPRFGSASYTLADFNDAVIAETSAEEVITRTMPEDVPYLVQTNHMIEIKDRKDYAGLYENSEPVPGMTFLSAERKLASELKFDALLGNVTADELKDILRSSPVNIYHPVFMTLVSGITEYDGTDIKFHASAGFDPERGWNTYTFD